MPTIRTIHGDHYIDLSDDLGCDAIEAAQAYHGGQGCPLYGIGCSGLLRPDALGLAQSAVTAALESEIDHDNDPATVEGLQELDDALRDAERLLAALDADTPPDTAEDFAAA